nr:unnamed protein product [Spirometra erinaceieuropaei]
MEAATEKIVKYINEESLPTPLEIIWCDDLLSSALMCSTKVDEMTNSPVTRKYTMLLKTNAENTYLREKGAKNHYLAVPALLYYGACMAEYLPFRELFEHLSRYLKDEEQCWKHCMRIKRCLRNQEECGGYGKDQRYFEGAVRILMEQNNIDFRQLIAGKLSLTDLEKVQDQITLEEVHFPSFMTPFRSKSEEFPF